MIIEMENNVKSAIDELKKFTQTYPWFVREKHIVASEKASDLLSYLLNDNKNLRMNNLIRQGDYEQLQSEYDKLAKEKETMKLEHEEDIKYFDCNIHMALTKSEEAVKVLMETAKSSLVNGDQQ